MADNGSRSTTAQTQHDSIGLDDENLLAMYRQMILCRTLDERIWMLNRQGKAAIVASAQGHEAAQIGSAWALRKGTDQFYIYYRDLAILLVLGMTPVEIMSGFLAKEGEPLSGARQFPTHGAYPEYGIINLSNVVATQVPQAVGAALAAVAGVMVTLYYGVIDFFMGFIAGLKAFTAAVLGGIGSLPGAMLGGMLLGMVEAFWSGYFSVEYKDVAAFGILVLVLIFRPTGLLGCPEIEKV